MTEIKEKKYITLKLDLLFKKVFGDKEDLVPIKYLLKTVLNIEPMSIEILNTELIGRPYKDKRVHVDLIVELEDKTKIGIEINTDVNQEIINRNIYYICKNMSKDLIPNEKYKELNKHIQINMDFKGKHKKPILKYSLIEEETREKLTDVIEIIRIDIPYYVRECYNKDISKLDKLTKLLGLFGIEDKELAETLCKGDKSMEKIMKRIEKYNDDEDVIGAYDFDEKMEFIAASREREARKNGIEEGIEQGSEQKQIDIAKNMLNRNTDIEFISEVTGLTIEQIQNLD